MPVTSETDIKLAGALCGSSLEVTPEIKARASYHGIGPLLLERSGATAFQDVARACTMWELKHRHVLVRLLSAYAAAGIRCLVMKGTALAYDLYPEPALRPRGDSDLLIAAPDLVRARQTLQQQGYVAVFDELSTSVASQELWRLAAADGSTHDIDLHWQAFNGPALAGLIPVVEAFAEAAPLPRLAPEAMALSHPHALLHACVHRAQHILSPYFVDGKAHYGGDRLIWLCDLDLMARAMTSEDWGQMTDKAVRRGVAPVCHDALSDAMQLLKTPVPRATMAQLAAAPGGSASDYLLHRGRAGRAAANLKAKGLRGAWAYAGARLFPIAAFVRAQYPQSRLPLPLLYLRRIGRFLAGGRR